MPDPLTQEQRQGARVNYPTAAAEHALVDDNRAGPVGRYATLRQAAPPHVAAHFEHSAVWRTRLGRRDLSKAMEVNHKAA